MRTIITVCFFKNEVTVIITTYYMKGKSDLN